jgi:hypothetical protein
MINDPPLLHFYHHLHTRQYPILSPITQPAVKQQGIRAGLNDANRVLGSSASEAEKAEARVEVEVFEGLQAALAK